MKGEGFGILFPQRDDFSERIETGSAQKSRKPILSQSCTKTTPNSRCENPREKHRFVFSKSNGFFAMDLALNQFFFALNRLGEGFQRRILEAYSPQSCQNKPPHQVTVTKQSSNAHEKGHLVGIRMSNQWWLLCFKEAVGLYTRCLGPLRFKPRLIASIEQS